MDGVEIPVSSRDIRFLQVFGVAVVCAGIGLGAKKRLSKVASARLWNGLAAVVGLAFGVFCYNGITVSKNFVTLCRFSTAPLDNCMDFFCLCEVA
mmetsp:Transcript_34484/g.135674  ORF Transcript_34484/g.135674 Transcript_34484/m.135674 type:complete len:95 (-) Transcript_34484:2858-3142(-)